MIAISVLAVFGREVDAFRRRPCSPKNCQVSSWTRWSTCSRKCDQSGFSQRVRQKTVLERCGGRCLFHLTERRVCNPCSNGGTRTSNGRCICVSGYTGTCCERSEYIVLLISYTLNTFQTKMGFSVL
jgi:hypothetical protein